MVARVIVERNPSVAASQGPTDQLRGLGLLAIVASTLTIAALFQPVRHRIQGFIDRRFYRRKYNAALVLARLELTLRDDIELEHLTERLLSVVDETLEPSHAALWLRNAGNT